MASLDSDTRVSREKRAFIRAFYEISDRETALDEYVDSFTEDTDFVMGPKVCKGKKAVREYRPSMWTAISYRKHRPEKLFLGVNENELMIYGTVDYRLRKSGTTVDGVSWAGRMVFDSSAPGQNPRLALYHVWFDPGPVTKALEEEA